MATTNRKPPKTWSLLGDVKRRPSVYEVTAAKFNYHFRREPAPFEMDPGAPINKWYLANREGSVFNVDDWEGFRDPAKLTYSEYVMLQHDRETYLDAVIDHHESAESMADLDAAWAEALTRIVVPLRFPLHILQMTSLYVAQMAPSAFIINCANFQAADEMRRVQRLAYFTKMLANAHGDSIAETAAAREPWESDEHWQPMRKMLEQMLGIYDWGQAFVVLNLVVKPTIDALVNGQVAALAENNGDEMLAQLLSEFQRDANRGKDWATALMQYATLNDPTLADVARAWADEWVPAAEETAVAWAALLSSAPNAVPSDEVIAAARQARADLMAACGL
jgi:toluene monooxygenase system protein E